MSQSDDMEAIDRYMKETPVQTPEAQKIRDAWIPWFDGLSWFKKAADGATYDEARNRRNDFNKANAKTLEEKKAVEEVMKHGISSEQAAGQPDRRLADGSYPKAPWYHVPLEFKIGAAVVGAAGLLLYGLKKAYIDPWLPKKH